MGKDFTDKSIPKFILRQFKFFQLKLPQIVKLYCFLPSEIRSAIQEIFAPDLNISNFFILSLENNYSRQDTIHGNMATDFVRWK